MLLEKLRQLLGKGGKIYTRDHLPRHGFLSQVKKLVEKLEGCIDEEKYVEEPC